MPGQQTWVTKRFQDYNQQSLQYAGTATSTHLIVPGLPPGFSTWCKDSSNGARTTARSYDIVLGKQLRVTKCASSGDQNCEEKKPGYCKGLPGVENNTIQGLCCFFQNKRFEQ